MQMRTCGCRPRAQKNARHQNRMQTNRRKKVPQRVGMRAADKTRGMRTKGGDANANDYDKLCFLCALVCN